ncbi:MAG: hypothetical protein PVF49_07370 [Anaerolineales bacterium]|jgi:hypothetical protein
MITPAGTDCPYYYEDFNRGRETQECRLIERTPNGGVYSTDLCSKCPVPRIVRANACPKMVLEARVHSRFFGLQRMVEVTAFCTRSMSEVEEPEIGCGQCHLEFEGFPVAPSEDS